MDTNQLSFDFLEDIDEINQYHFPYRKIQQRAIGFLQKEFKSHALACDVPLGIKNYKSPVVGLRKISKKNISSIIVEIFTDRDKCFNSCANANKINMLIEKLVLEKEALEAIIRKNEPHLQSKDDLFADFPTYHYEKSSNPDYKKLIHELNNLKHTLNFGGRLENIGCSEVANEMYLLVPEKLILPDECANNWGLIYFDRDLKMSLVREAKKQEVDPIRQQNLIFNVAFAAKKNVLFSHGVKVVGKNTIKFLAPPKQRRKLN
ncbi:MAG: hypothetical protein IJW31_03515 [Lentisphaeria bacterium]|nr:hypothetical protein [Lentisphaeria bacterium]MBR7128259.1 hypothetical protein [Lentisphaeria bacterium]